MATVCAMALAVSTTLAGCSSTENTRGPLKIGVMLPLTGANAVGYRTPLQWAVDAVNAAGGVDGRHLELAFADTAKQPASKIAGTFAHDDSIVAAVGPDNSEDALGAAATFVKAHKLIVTPSATSADLFRAFAADNPRYVWRPVESDIAQTRALLELASHHGATSAALVTGRSAYGTTFFDWFGFLAEEAGLKVTATVRYDESSQSCDGPVGQALTTAPQVLIAAPDNTDQADCMALAWKQHGSRPPIFFSDSAQSTRVDGIEGTAPAPDPNNLFTRAYTGNFGKAPPPYAANAYDSVLLIAYGLARSHTKAGPALANAVKAVTGGADATVGWDATGIRQALTAIRQGRLPAVNGAVGPWHFDRTAGLELTASTYENWQVSAGGRFSIAGFLPMTSDPNPTPAPERADQLAATTAFQPPPKTGTWALLVAASEGWDNYRHQADVLAQYERLRANGVAADHIVVVMADDIADNPKNEPRETVRYTVDGPNLDGPHVHADYSPTKLTAGRLMDVLAGRANGQTPKVIDSGPGDDVYVYLAGHGNDSGLYLGLGQPIPSASTPYSVLTPSALDDTISHMATQHRYRQLVVAIEACQSGAFGGGEGFSAPGALLLTAAGPNEDSLSTNYDPTLRTWLADQFSYQLYRAEAQPTTTLDQLYRSVYLNVAGAHVRAYGPNFGDPAAVTVGGFLSP